ALIEQGFKLVDIDIPCSHDGNGYHFGAALGADHLPGDDVGMVLELGYQHAVTGIEVMTPPAVRHQINGFGHAAHPDNLPGTGAVEKTAGGFAGAFKRLGRSITEGVNAAMNIGVVVAVI